METKTLAHSTAEKLVQYIREQQLAPGAKIPTEYELARMLGVGRNTLREAVRMLASRNILEIRQGARLCARKWAFPTIRWALRW